MSDVLNFTTHDTHCVGALDVFSTKATKAEKKDYKKVKAVLDKNYEDLRQAQVCKLAWMKAKGVEITEEDSREPEQSSVFGNLHTDSKARRTFYFVTQALNLVHPEYDITQALQLSDFKRVSLNYIQKKMTDQLGYLYPRKRNFSRSDRFRPTQANKAGNMPPWDNKCWAAFHKIMELRACKIYEYAPEEDPYVGDVGSSTYVHFVFFNTFRKRISVLHWRIVSIMATSPVRHDSPPKRRKVSDSFDVATGAAKRKDYWFSDQAPSYARDGSITGMAEYDDDEEDMEPATYSSTDDGFWALEDARNRIANDEWFDEDEDEDDSQTLGYVHEMAEEANF
ncbi:hypothetical protein MBLNU230_g7296t1 [Neophaeotheca triangularis]